MYMLTINSATLRSQMRLVLACVGRGEEVEIARRNVPIARLIPVPSAQPNSTQLGCGRGTGQVHGELTEPFLLLLRHAVAGRR